MAVAFALLFVVPGAYFFVNALRSTTERAVVEGGEECHVTLRERRPVTVCTAIVRFDGDVARVRVGRSTRAGDGVDVLVDRLTGEIRDGGSRSGHLAWGGFLMAAGVGFFLLTTLIRPKTPSLGSPGG